MFFVLSGSFSIKAGSSTRNNKKLLLKEEKIKQDKNFKADTITMYAERNKKL